MADFKDTFFSTKGLPSIYDFAKERATINATLQQRNRQVADAIAANDRGPDVDPYTSNIGTQKTWIESMDFYARPTRFFFHIDRLRSEVNERLNRNGISTTLPGRSLMTQPMKVYGPPKEHAYEINYSNEIQMTFRVGGDMFERTFFEDWISSTLGTSTSDVRYPDDYRTTLRIYQLDRTDHKVMGIELYDCFCKSVGDMELNTEASDQIATITASFAYSEYQIIGRAERWSMKVPLRATNNPRNITPMLDTAENIESRTQ
jgi:hypothetical protein